MQALDLLHSRSSQPRLAAPAPEGEALNNILRAALKAPDHAALTPWRFIVCQGEGLKRLGDIYQQAAVKEEKPEHDIARAKQLPLRAPMVIVAIAKYTEHAKVPKWEQIASASCAVQAMQMAAFAQGFGGVWRTGGYSESQNVCESLQLGEDDKIVGYLYLGSPQTTPLPKPEKALEDYFEFWD